MSRLINFKININLDYKIFYFILLATLFNEISILSFLRKVVGHNNEKGERV